LANRDGVSRLVLVCLVAFGLAGCGRADDERTVSSVTERFLRAVSTGDGERACAQLSDGARQALEHDESKSCAEAAPEIEEVEPSALTRAQVFATTAKVDLADGHSAFLELTRRGWRIAAAGCRPQGGDMPYQCELEA
jgi:hypothetical protein